MAQAIRKPAGSETPSVAKPSRLGILPMVYLFGRKETLSSKSGSKLAFLFRNCWKNEKKREEVILPIQPMLYDHLSHKTLSSRSKKTMTPW